MNNVQRKGSFSHRRIVQLSLAHGRPLKKFLSKNFIQFGDVYSWLTVSTVPTENGEDGRAHNGHIPVMLFCVPVPLPL